MAIIETKIVGQGSVEVGTYVPGNQSLNVTDCTGTHLTADCSVVRSPTDHSWVAAYPVSGWHFVSFSFSPAEPAGFFTLNYDGGVKSGFFTDQISDVEITLNFESDPVEGDYCLTTSVFSGTGTILSPVCPASPKSLGESCSGDRASGTPTELIAAPGTNWEVLEWISSPSISMTIGGVGNTVAAFNMPSEDLDVTVTFVQSPVDITLEVGDGNPDGWGCIELVSPVVIMECYGGTTSVDANTYPNIVVNAVASPGYVIKNWVIDEGSPQNLGWDQITVDIQSVATKTIRVNFEEIPDCDTKTLTVNIVGSGTVNYTSGHQFCEGSVINVQATPSPGHRFKEWSGAISGSFNPKALTMDNNREITATFEIISDEITEDPFSEAALFYCPSESYKDNVISFNFVNDLASSSFHFRVDFYAEESAQNLIYSAFSFSDNKRWFYDNTYFEQIPETGVEVSNSQTVNIVYDPEFLPQVITETQKEHLIDGSVTYEKPLVCGVKYYVNIVVYNLSDASETPLETMPIILDCEKVDSYYWNYNKDRNKWLCSGQGKMDLKVADGFNQSINPSIDSNIFGVYQIAWQGRRKDGNNIYGALWDSTNDVLYSSGQGLYNILELTSSNSPMVLSDPVNNFYITSYNRDSIKFKSCGIKVCEEDSVTSSTADTDAINKLCYPGELTLLSSSYDQVKMRVYQEDISGSLVVNDNKVVPVISKRSIRIDVDGVVGAYAVRLRNIGDDDWSNWLNIDSELSGVSDSGAYRIDNSRFIIPWDVTRNNGLRRICCQVLTMYGISNTFCLDMLINFDVPQHIFKFYSIEERTEESEFQKYNGQYVLSVKNSATPDAESATIYFSVIFSEEIYKDESSLIPYVDNDLKFNLVQQGVNDVRKQNLKAEGDNKTFTGEFIISKDDGIFNKDGTAFIEIILPVSTDDESCSFDESDKYNLVNSDLEEIANVDLNPEESYSKYQADQLSKALDLNRFKQYYDKDDTNFKFGNPGYYRE